jgi:hypothetical protein
VNTDSTPSSPPAAPAPAPKPRRKAPSRGGRRQGAGRPRTHAPDSPPAKIAVYLPASLLAALDAARLDPTRPATASRSAAIADAIQSWLDHHGARSQPPASTTSLPALSASPPSLPPL